MGWRYNEHSEPIGTAEKCGHGRYGYEDCDACAEINAVRQKDASIARLSAALAATTRVAQIAQHLYIAWSRGRLEANKARWTDLGAAIETWDPMLADSSTDPYSRVLGILRRCLPHLRMATSITSGREFKETVHALIADIERLLTPPAKPEETDDVPDATRANAARWHALATMFGYNELTKRAQTLGEKVYCRLGRDQAEENYKKLGGELTREIDDSRVVLVLTEHMPHVTFRDKDVELMRAVVRKFDAAAGVVSLSDVERVFEQLATEYDADDHFHLISGALRTARERLGATTKED
jgi:hypothetical protein